MRYAAGGPVLVAIPAGTQSDSLPRLRGKGLPQFGGAECGDLYLSPHSRIQEKPSAAERRQFERFREMEKQTSNADATAQRQE